MRFQSQKVAYWFFATCMLLLSLQIVYGFIMGFARIGMDGLHDYIPFNTARATHTNLLVVWLLTGFMGAAYYIIPEESDRELYSVKLAYIQLISWVVVGVVAIVGFHFNWWEGRKFLEIPRPLDYLVVVNVLTFLFNIAMTIWEAKKRSTTQLVLFFGLLCAALLYLPGMIYFDNQTLDSYFRWWVVHLWVEGVWELIMGGILAFLLIKLTGVDREVIEKWLYVVVGLTFLSGILGTGHHYYWIGTPKYWLMVGGIFSALEPLAFLGMAIWALNMYRKKGKDHPNKIALYWTLGSAMMSFIGAGFLGFAHTWPAVNQWTHGTLVTAMHGHLAFWGAYAMLVLAVISYAMPNMTGRKLFTGMSGYLAFWASNIGMLGMTGALAVAGITQVYLERKLGMDFLVVQKEIIFHFYGMLLAATLFTIGITYFIVDFIRHGLPSNEALGKNVGDLD
ncbi:Nitric oxide reductase large subunit [Leptospira biflexa serovar Patoc strain 'Patoc 1 (Ames)']|uniref:Nitric-oxide reductase subunit B (Nitric oxide reductase cytochrome b subunit NOR large subunit) putative membrane protein n=1 Tax=Leptospira biflexa serovar Patoc (strain Patoc 1 / ATCC 23582 / Paris) TaxID=456481 RepID=B0SP10_LEPBP|nr:cbb3-type cytochrome c oxidase subunit I [Leptospira biflexa]ABZ95329.1 Nitric oxide reductase large subunit [Leptospira biflexa serovar Patoc strain 'Patoc 1 (Ames)']ABZ99022.1 Nitric-oxide reductase subunit B (Nitric oxide reductase cytochrome b subunit; NOR large subunit); putative membrane protein [Leptospira biflexa serovar Patoc strain 'Patoc 1 (Paris)']TGM31874.1 nitric-oxide reductase large subunit [Leptospira biflexa]TGM37016.1 nitric-oxide reductase large subunit [Leptospira biflex